MNEDYVSDPETTSKKNVSLGQRERGFPVSLPGKLTCGFKGQARESATHIARVVVQLEMHIERRYCVAQANITSRINVFVKDRGLVSQGTCATRS